MTNYLPSPWKFLIGQDTKIIPWITISQNQCTPGSPRIFTCLIENPNLNLHLSLESWLGRVDSCNLGSPFMVRWLGPSSPPALAWVRAPNLAVRERHPCHHLNSWVVTRMPPLKCFTFFWWNILWNILPLEYFFDSPGRNNDHKGFLYFIGNLMGIWEFQKLSIPKG